MVERFGAGSAPEIQFPVAMSLANKGYALDQLEETEQAIATFDEVVERFGDSDVPELQFAVATALANKGLTQGHLGEVQAAIITCDEVVARFKDSDAPEIRIQVTIALWAKTKALLVRKEPLIAMDTFRSMYAAFVPGHEILMNQLVSCVADMIAAGASEHDLVEVLSDDKEKADTIVPLVVALRQRAGEVVRAPGEVLEVAADIRDHIEAKVGSNNGGRLAAPSNQRRATPSP